MSKPTTELPLGWIVAARRKYLVSGIRAWRWQNIS